MTEITDNDTDGDDLAQEKSKSLLKREADALQEHGERLVQLPVNILDSLALPTALLSAVLEAKKIKSRSALKRQRQYIGRLMRELDVTHVVAKLLELNQGHALRTADFHLLEQWRDRILADGDSAIDELIADHPAADRQRLRQLYRQAQKEQQQGAAPKGARQLYQYLKEILLSGNNAPPEY